MAAKPARVHYYASGLMHPFFREQYRHCPPGYVYEPSTPAIEGHEVRSDIRKISRKSYGFRHRLQRSAVRAAGWVGAPRMAQARPNGADLIHSTRDLLWNRTHWVVEVEVVTTLAWYNRRALHRRRLRRVMEAFFASRSCRRILPWTEAAKTSLINSLDCRQFEAKLQVVYPCIEAGPLPERREARQEIRLLFVGTEFYAKGGMETLLAFDRLAAQRPHLRLDLVTFAPRDLDPRWRQRAGVHFHSGLSPEALAELYREADIFVVPTHKDVLGYVFLEAFTYGLPCVGTRHFAVPEIIIEGRTGFLVDSPVSMYGADCLPRYDAVPLEGDGHPFVEALKKPTAAQIDELTAALTPLVDNRELRLEMGRAGYSEVTQGKFAPRRRCQALAEVYKECLGRHAESEHAELASKGAEVPW